MSYSFYIFCVNYTATTWINMNGHTLSRHNALPIWAPAADGDKAGQVGNAGSGGGAGTALPASRERWSRKPLDLAALRAIDADVKLVAKALVADKLRLTNARLEAVLADGLLELKRFTADGYGGALAPPAIGRASCRERGCKDG